MTANRFAALQRAHVYVPIKWGEPEADDARDNRAGEILDRSGLCWDDLTAAAQDLLLERAVRELEAEHLDSWKKADSPEPEVVVA